MLEFSLAHPFLTIWTVLILALCKAVQGGYVVDDDMHWKHMQDMKKNFPGWPHFIYDALYGAGLFRNAKIEHIATLILHGINSSLIYRMIENNVFVSMPHGSALAVSLLYLINPIFNQTAVWLNGRRYAVSLFAVLLACNFWTLALSMAMFVGWFHISGAAFPLLFLWTPFWPLALTAPALVVLFMRNRFFGTLKARRNDFKPGNENQKITWKKIIVYVKTIGYHFCNCVLPRKPAMYHNFLFYFSATEEGTREGYKLNFDFWKGLAVIAFLAWDHSFWSFWFVLFISQWCNLYQVTMNASDRYCTIAGVGVMALIVKYAMLTAHPEIVFAGLAVYYLVKYQPLFLAYKSVENFHLYHIAQQPDIINPRFFLSKIYLAHKDPWQAFAVIKQGLRYKPHDFKLLLGFIECLFALHKPKAALQAMELAEKYIPFGEHEDTKNLFDGIRKQFAKEYRELQDSKDEIDRMTPDELFDEMEKIKNKTSALPVSKRYKVQQLYKRIQGVKVSK